MVCRTLEAASDTHAFFLRLVAPRISTNLMVKTMHRKSSHYVAIPLVTLFPLVGGHAVGVEEFRLDKCRFRLVFHNVLSIRGGLRQLETGMEPAAENNISGNNITILAALFLKPLI